MIPLEDNFNDILGKAQRGLGLSDLELSRKAGIAEPELEKVREGIFDETIVRKLAPVLNLRVDALVALGRKEWAPRDAGEVEGLAAFTTTYGDITVNAYLVWDPASREAAVFDTGADCGLILTTIRKQNLQPKYILLTHTHEDHVADLAKLKAATKAPCFVSKAEAFADAESFEAGREFMLGNLRIETRSTTGHSRGGITYVISHLTQPVAVVGDSIFAGSMGGGAVSYQDALRNNRTQILTLPDNTIICPGHGPLTTVGEEKQHNPFFP